MELKNEMRKALFIVFLLFSFGINIKHVNAIECDNQDIERLKVLAQDVTVDYNYVGTSNGGFSEQAYEVSFNGINNELFVSYYINSTNKKYIYNSSDKIEIDSGNRIFSIYSTKCNVKLRDISVDLPKFNTYSNSNVCKMDEYKDLDYCYEWYQGDIDSSVFENKIDEVDESLVSDSFGYDKIYNFIMNNLLYVILGVVLLIIIIIILFVRRYKKNQLY